MFTRLESPKTPLGQDPSLFTHMQTNYTFVEHKNVLVVPQDPSAGEKCFGLLPAGVCINGSKFLDPPPGIR